MTAGESIFFPLRADIKDIISIFFLPAGQKEAFLDQSVKNTKIFALRGKKRHFRSKKYRNFRPAGQSKAFLKRIFLSDFGPALVGFSLPPPYPLRRFFISAPDGPQRSELRCSRVIPDRFGQKRPCDWVIAFFDRGASTCISYGIWGVQKPPKRKIRIFYPSLLEPYIWRVGILEIWVIPD